ncbi:MAG: hydrogenase maturation nickel metallochaperone HypA [Nitrospiraceae bacterium]|nr:hydrogenase maturation nickel metallochaperone HypA [Nitrospiraceae bacterium]
MHEVSIAANLIEIVSEQCRKGGYLRIESINLKLGRASGIMPDALLFAFDAMKTDSPARDAVLMVEEVPVSGRCGGCGGTFTVQEEYVLHCPLCGGGSFQIVGGRELDIVDMEVSE